MKNMARNILFSTFLLLASVAYGAAVPTIDVTVSTLGGKVAFRGKTDAEGLFVTPNLAPGSYAVQFNAKGMKAGHYVIVVSAGKKKVTADSVVGDQFSKGGVAMKVDVGPGVKITGHVALAGGALQPGMVWIPKQLGSNRAAHWAPEGSAEAVQAKQSGSMSKEGVQKMMESPDSGGG
jgi:hypothetical protein